jgi:hypothetical protein
MRIRKIRVSEVFGSLASLIGPPVAPQFDGDLSSRAYLDRRARMESPMCPAPINRLRRLADVECEMPLLFPTIRSAVA